MAEQHRKRYESKSKGPSYPIPPFSNSIPILKKKAKIVERSLPNKIRELVPESQAYLDLLSFEKKLDTTIMRKRLDIQEALKRPMKTKRKLRIFISHTCFPGSAFQDSNSNTENRVPPCWELRVEGKLLSSNQLTDNNDSLNTPMGAPSNSNLNLITNPINKKFSSFFKSLVIELDKNLYGPDNHLVEWHRTAHTQETDGFQVKRLGGISVTKAPPITMPGNGEVPARSENIIVVEPIKCTLLLMLDYQPPQFKLDPRLGRLLAIHTQTRPVIITSLWQYIKTHKLQDSHEREYINCDSYLSQIFECQRLKFAEIPQKLNSLLFPPDPIIIHHTIKWDMSSVPAGTNVNPAAIATGGEKRNTSCYDVEVEIDDNLKGQMGNFLMSTTSQLEIMQLDHKIQETIETINTLKINREFFNRFASEPQTFIDDWLRSQCEDLKTITDSVGNPESERLASYYTQPWVQEAVGRYFFNKVQQRRFELEQALGLKN